MITLKKIGKNFNNRWIFRNIDLHVAQKESVVIIGPSGGGKSVLLKTIAGLIPPNEGTYKLKSQNVGMLFRKMRSLTLSRSKRICSFL